MCDTREWIDVDSYSGWLDVKVRTLAPSPTRVPTNYDTSDSRLRSSLKVIITVGELQYEVVQTNSFCYRSLDHDLTPRLSAVSPRHAAAGTVLKLEGKSASLFSVKNEISQRIHRHFMASGLRVEWDGDNN